VLATALILVLTLLVLIRGGPPDPERYTIGGIDVSHHQGSIDWHAVAGSDVRFAYIKATEGRDFLDADFEFNWREARERGIARGAYHYFTFCSSGLEQARHFLRVVPPEPGALVPVADIEFGGNCSSYGHLEEVRQELAIFLDEVERAWRRKPILYLTLRSKLQIADARFDGYPVWFRNVFWRLPNDIASQWVIWQYADDGRVPGIRGPVDRNVLHPDISVSALRVAP